MTVRELVARLLNENQDAVVKVWSLGDGGIVDVVVDEGETNVERVVLYPKEEE